MSSVAHASSSCLLAILLVTHARTGSGAQIVFHYPPLPLSDQNTKRLGTTSPDDQESSSSDSESASSSDDDGFQGLLHRAKPAPQRPLDQKEPPNEEDDEGFRKGQCHSPGKPSWEPLLGLGEEGLVSLLAPGRAWHKRKFEMMINDLVFVGRPVYSRKSGAWNRRKRDRGKPNIDKDHSEEPSDTATDSEQDADPRPPVSKTPPKQHSDRKSPLTMFNVVFVLNPTSLEHTIRVKEIYDNVVRKFSKVLKWEQARAEYVGQQSELIQAIKSSCLAKKAPTSTLYAEVLAQSSLAVAVSTIYKALSASRIAAVKLSSDVSISLQIPPVTSVSYLPSLTDPPIQPGLWLTTANDSTSHNSDLDTATAASALQLSKQFSLLLKESPQKILREVQAAGGPLALPLANFVDKARPTKSFYKISLANQISLADIQLLARHLIYWRRAIAIPPLHHRDTYIASPNADISKLLDASKSFESAFPMMPSLPRILNMLSQTPTPFGTLIPSSDHKEEYYRVLAWLMRGGWVTQLRTFVYVRVDTSVKKAVKGKDRADRNHRTHNSSPDKPNQDLSQHSTPISTSLHSHRRPSLPSRPSSEGHQSISTNTSHSQQKAPATTSASMSSLHTSSLVLSPLRATALESKYLSFIADSLLTTHSGSEKLTQAEKEEIATLWPTLVKYFNGSEPLEMIPVREGLKRKVVWDVLGRIGLRFEGGVRDERSGIGRRGGGDGVLVCVRHW